METLETERQSAKPPLRPKPPMPKRAQDDGWLMGGKGRPARPPVPAKRPASEFPAGEAPQGWGNVRKIRERFDKAAESPETARVGATKEKQPLAVRRSESAREVARDAPPVPKARRKRAVSRETSAKRSEDQTAAVPAITEPPESQEPSSDHRGESETVQTDAPGETVGEGHCPISCPCLCHRGRPGMVLVWRPASESTAADPGLTDSSLSDSAESDDKPFAYVFTVNETPNGCPAETAPEEAGAEDDGYLCLLPSALGEIPSDGGLGPGAERAGSSPVPPGAAPLPKPPRRHKPPAQTSPDTAPRLPARREARLRRSEALPPPPPATASVLQRYSTADLDKFSKCVDQLNLHVRGLVLPGRGPSTLMPPSPTVTRSAPPSPTEKHVQPTYDQVDAGEEESVRIGLYELHLDAPLSRSLKSEDRNSKGWESRFESEPLYQTYRDTVIHKQIKRQTLMRDSSKTSDDYTYESIPLAVESDRATSSLWQNLNAVRQSGILEGLSPEERKQQESMFEVLTSEASYLRSLNILIDHFMHSRVLNDSIILRDKKTLFSSIVRVAEVSASFLKDLEERVDENIKITDVCDIIHRHAQQNFQIYIDYVRNQFYQEQKYSQLMEENAHFAAAVVRLQELPQCQRLPLMSFLLLPFQRITRIKMLIENILQRSEVGSINEETASKALSVVSKIIEDCNREVGIMKQMEEMIHIMKKLEFDKLKAIPIISKLRHLEKQGELSEVVHRGNRFGVKPKVTLLYLFLFNDLLLVTVKKSGDRYQVLDYAHRSLVEVQESSSNWPGTSAANCFVLTLLENRLGKQSERLLKAPTQSDRHRWMNALSSGRYVNPEDAKDDKVYECWDCPQVQCLIPYTAQQADELSLEAADIINVTKKSSEGWYEGSKLSNGQKGWFPSDRVQEITNEHVRRRNLRERYRLLQAAQHLHDKQDGDGAGGERANTSL